MTQEPGKEEENHPNPSTESGLSRRDFLRSAALLGLSLSAGEVLASCRASRATEVPYDPLETLYALDYITTTPDGTSQGPGVAAASNGATPVPPKMPEWFFDCCGEHFRTLDDLKKHAGAEHAKRLPDIKRVDQPTYEQFLTDEIGPFDEKYTCFSRAAWDEPFQVLAAEYAAKAPVPDLERIEGQALVAGAIYADKTAGALHPYYPGYFGHLHDIGGLYSWDDPVSEVDFPVPDPIWMSERVKQVARFYGANLVGITTIDPRWVYSNFFEPVTGNAGPNQVDYKYAIVMGVEMDWAGINDSPRENASAATALIYSRIAELAASLAKYIRSLGYPAIPCGNDTTQSIPLAIDAGLGELGRNGLLLTPEYGPRQRLCKVLTNLPLVPDQPIDFGIQTFCESCHACASACPVNAIRFEDRTTEQTSVSNRPGIRRWPVDVARCYMFWQENGCDCANCVAACPWALHTQRSWLEIES